MEQVTEQVIDYKGDPRSRSDGSLAAYTVLDSYKHKYSSRQ